MRKLLSLLLAAPLAAATIAIDAGSASDQFAIGGLTDFTISYPGVTGDTSLRYGAFRYHIPAEPGAYLVTLNFRETGTVTRAGQRVFSVKLNGQTIIDKLDLFKQSGMALHSPQFVTGATNGFIDIDFSYTTKSAIVSSIQVDVIGTIGQVPGTGFPEGYGFSRKIDEPVAAGSECQPGDYAEGSSVATTMLGVNLYVCIAGALRRFRSDPEPWGNAAVSDLGGVLQMEAQGGEGSTLPPVFYFRTNGGQMIGPFSFTGPGPIPLGLRFPVHIQPFPRAAAQ